jgi:predicted ester cyclase
VSAEEQKPIVRRYFAEAFSRGNLAVIDEVAAAKLAAEMKRGIAGRRTAFADVVDNVQDQIAEGDRVATRFSGGGTHHGASHGVAPTGKAITWSGIAIDRFADGKIVERRVIVDVAGVLQQLGE